jgi:hypothetical protein
MREPTYNPDVLDRATAAALRAVASLVALVGLAAVVLSLTGCGGAGAITGVAGVVKTTLDVLRQTRAVLCTPALDPLMGDPREGQPQWVQKDASIAADAAGD